MSDNIDVPPVVRARAAAAPGGPAWIADLPQRLTNLQNAWSVTTTDNLPGGTASLVARAITDDGQQVVMKVAVPGEAFEQQARTLAAAEGDGYVRLLRYDPQENAALLEACGTSLHESGLPPGWQLSILARLLCRAWRVPPAADQVPVNKADSLAELVGRLWDELGQPCSERVVAHALECASRRSASFDPRRAVVVHGDAAAPNVARVLVPRAGTEDGFVLLDPEGFLGDNSYDLGVAVRDWCPELQASPAPGLLLAGWCRLLAKHASADPVAIWEWGYLERVSTGLYAMSLGAGDDALAHFWTADALLDDRTTPASRSTGTMRSTGTTPSTAKSHVDGT